MARGYKATLEVKCWKEHTCCYCGAPYRYVLRKKMTGRGSSQESAVQSATNRGVRALGTDVGQRPCPGCGNYQPDMVGARRFALHGFWLIVIAAIVAAAYVFGVSELIPRWAALLLLVFTAAVTLVRTTWVGVRDPNRDLKANKALADKLVAQGVLQPVATEPEREERARPVVIETGPGYWLAFLLLAATLLFMPFAELIRRSGGWETNADWHPSIVGPGDTAWTWIEPEQPIESVRGQWRATGSGKIVNAKAMGLKDDTVNVVVTSHNAPWSLGSVQAPTAARAPVRLWARVTFPNGPRELARRSVTVELNLSVTYPDVDANDRIVDSERSVKYTTDVDLASPHAGFLYGFFWNVAVLGGGGMFLLAGIYHLARDYALIHAGLPTRVTPVTDEETARA